MAILFEYHNRHFINDPIRLKGYLHDVWNKRFRHQSWQNESEDLTDSELLDRSDYQPFLIFDGNIIQARNYIGFISFEGEHIEIYPKVFKETDAGAGLIIRHIFFWFDYCRRWKFPFTQNRLRNFNTDSIPEMIIYLMAVTLLETVEKVPLSLYQETEQVLTTPRGRLNFKKYLSGGFSNGQHHLVDCDVEPFLFDNRVNQTIKYVTRLLQFRSRDSVTRQKLDDLIFILDEVEDRTCTVHDLKNLPLNPIYSGYQQVSDICISVLEQMIYSNSQYDFNQWSLLIPMEYVFEDFIAGFLEREFSSECLVEYQKSDKYFSVEPEAFQMRHDIFLTLKKSKRKIIVDTKYKIRPRDFKKDKKKGISNSDMYQVSSYAFRRGCRDVLLLYPNIDSNYRNMDKFIIQSGFETKEKITVRVAEVPFWSLDGVLNLESLLKDAFRILLNDFY